MGHLNVTPRFRVLRLYLTTVKETASRTIGTIMENLPSSSRVENSFALFDGIQTFTEYGCCTCTSSPGMQLCRFPGKSPTFSHVNECIVPLVPLATPCFMYVFFVTIHGAPSTKY